MNKDLNQSRRSPRAFLIALGAMIAMALMPAMASAQAVADADVISAVTDSTGTISATLTSALPLLLAVTVVWVLISVGKRLVKKAGS